MKVLFKYLRNIALISLLCFLNYTCTETFEFKGEDFENILVIEGNITDQVGIKEIKLSRTFLSGEGLASESGAQVSVVDDQDNIYQFQEQDSGLYISLMAFGAVEGREYTLKINTADGKSYSSLPVSLPPSAEIENIEAVRRTVNGLDGVAILVNSTGQNGETNFYRYTFQETYRIESFFKPNLDLVVVSENPPELELVRKTREESICYNTLFSNSILVANSNNLNENTLSDFQIRFIDKLDPIIASRYSILVKQFSQSREANTFYNNLKDFSSIENLFSQTQPGFINSNVNSENNLDEKVLGFFEVTSLTSKRIFFSFNDIFENEIPFSPVCERESFPVFSIDLFNLIKNGRFKYIDSGFEPDVHFITLNRCVDCNEFGTNIIPDFWVD